MRLRPRRFFILSIVKHEKKYQTKTHTATDFFSTNEPSLFIYLIMGKPDYYSGLSTTKIKNPSGFVRIFYKKPRQAPCLFSSGDELPNCDVLFSLWLLKNTEQTNLGK